MNYATKIENETGFDTSIKICKKADLIRLDVSKLETTPVALTKLSDIVKNENVKNDKHDEFFKEINAIEATDATNLL